MKWREQGNKINVWSRLGANRYMNQENSLEIIIARQIENESFSEIVIKLVNHHPSNQNIEILLFGMNLGTI